MLENCVLYHDLKNMDSMKSAMYIESIDLNYVSINFWAYYHLTIIALPWIEEESYNAYLASYGLLV